VVRTGQEVLLIGRDLRENVRRDLSSLLLRKTGRELAKQRDHMVEARRTGGRRAVRLVGGRNRWVSHHDGL